MQMNMNTEPNPTPDQIQARAYQLWESAGREHGHDMEHWFQAETELRAASRRPSSGTHARKRPPLNRPLALQARGSQFTR